MSFKTFALELNVAISRLPPASVIGGVINKFDAKSAGFRYDSYDYHTYKNFN